MEFYSALGLKEFYTMFGCLLVSEIELNKITIL